MRAWLAILLISWPGAAAAVSARDLCEHDAQEVVEYARKRGYLFEATRASNHGACPRHASQLIFFASASSRTEVVCDVRIFFVRRTATADELTPARDEADSTPWSWATAALSGVGISFDASPASGSTMAPSAPAASTTGWTIRSIRVAGENAVVIYAERDTSGNDRGWTFQIKAAANQTLPFRIDQVEFETQQDCAQWRNAF